jgi:hypothetical protein
MKTTAPVARFEGLVIQEVKDEILVCDTVDNRAFCLNQTAAEVWKLCDGTNDAGSIARKLSVKFRQEYTEELVSFSLLELEREKLLEGAGITTPLAGMPRREAVRRVALATMVALPLITSLAVPRAIHAQSVGAGANGTACTLGGECASGNCVDGFCCNTACAALCQACSAAKKGSGANGACGNIFAGGDPDNECPGAEVCNGSGACRKINGSICTLGSECLSGNCVDGFCCNTACAGPCQACSNAKTGGANGTCTPIPDGQDPDNECAGTSVCNGAGGCRP